MSRLLVPQVQSVHKDSKAPSSATLHLTSQVPPQSPPIPRTCPVLGGRSASAGPDRLCHTAQVSRTKTIHIQDIFLLYKQPFYTTLHPVSVSFGLLTGLNWAVFHCIRKHLFIENVTTLIMLSKPSEHERIRRSLGIMCNNALFWQPSVNAPPPTHAACFQTDGDVTWD